MDKKNEVKFKAEQQAKFFSDYLSDKRILIADPSSVSRSALAKILTTMGAKIGHISLAMNFRTAEEEIKKNAPKVLICDYDLGKNCGLDLLQKQRLQNSDAKDSLFILVTGNTSQTAVARAAEEDVDTYIIKPFTPETLRNSILKAALAKLQPSEYLKTIERGKLELSQAKVDDAIKTFEFAKSLDPAPALACSYLGQAHLMKKVMNSAEGSYQRGLEFNKIHYKCLVGLYETLMAGNRPRDAYEVIKKISHYFPANPQRLTAVLRLAIVTQSYEDVERYYRIFTGLDNRNEEIIKYICAALVVCGKYYLGQKHGTRAMELFQKAATAASSRTHILREIILGLLESNYVQQAEDFLKKFPPETQNSVDYHAMNYLLTNRVLLPSLIIERGRELLGKGIYDPMIYKILIQRSIEMGLTPSAEDLIRDGIARWPDQKELFDKELKRIADAENAA